MSPNTPQDDLLHRYEQAKAQLPDGLLDAPSDALRARIMQVARAQAITTKSIALHAYFSPANSLNSSENAINTPMTAQEAANDSFWNIRALGSIAVMGLAGLLWWQFEHGTPQEQAAAKSAQPNLPAIAAPAPIPAPVITDAQIPEQTVTATAKAVPQIARSRVSETAPAPMASPSPQAEKTMPDSSGLGVQDAAPSALSASPAQAVVTAPRAITAPAPAARALIASPDKLVQAIEAKDAAALRQALSQGASPNANASPRSSEGHPALTLAVVQRWQEGVRILLAAGADRNTKNNKGHTALDVAFELGYVDISDLLATPR